jgi:hypothetical protein
MILAEIFAPGSIGPRNVPQKPTLDLGEFKVTLVTNKGY